MDCFLHTVDNLTNKIAVFGLHFASLDIRQESSVHGKLYESLAGKEKYCRRTIPVFTEEEKIKAILSIDSQSILIILEDPIQRDTLESIAAIKTIQQFNGAKGCHRYIISQCNSALNAMEVYGLFLLNGWKKEEINIDIVPLFETIDDLQRCRSRHAKICIPTLFTSNI